MNKEWLKGFSIKISQEAQEMAGSGKYGSVDAITDALSAKYAQEGGAEVYDIIKPARSTLSGIIAEAMKRR